MSYMKQDYPEDLIEFYHFLKVQMTGLTQDVPYFIANMSNISALLKDALENVNWVGFYFMEGGRLVLGPFQGKPACIEIAVGQGVCGTAVQSDEVQLVEDVHRFPGHIACDSTSRSEIVVPMHVDGNIVGVLDIDSPLFCRFNEDDRQGLADIVRTMEVMPWFQEYFRKAIDRS